VFEGAAVVEGALVAGAKPSVVKGSLVVLRGAAVTFEEVTLSTVVTLTCP